MDKKQNQHENLRNPYARHHGISPGTNTRKCGDAETAGATRPTRPAPPLDSRSTLNGSACLIPMHCLLTVIRFIGHVASQCRVMAEYRVFYDGLARAHGLEECPQMGLHVVVIRPLERNRFRHRLLTELRIVLLVPLLLVGFAHGVRET